MSGKEKKHVKPMILAREKTVGAILEKAKLSDDALALAPSPNEAPEFFLDRLIEADLLDDAIAYLAFALQKRNLVWWGWYSVYERYVDEGLVAEAKRKKEEKKVEKASKKADKKAKKEGHKEAKQKVKGVAAPAPAAAGADAPVPESPAELANPSGAPIGDLHRPLPAPPGADETGFDEFEAAERELFAPENQLKVQELNRARAEIEQHMIARTGMGIDAYAQKLYADDLARDEPIEEPEPPAAPEPESPEVSGPPEDVFGKSPASPFEPKPVESPDDPRARQAMLASLRWIAAPSDEHGRASFESAEVVGMDHPWGLVAASAHWSGKNIGEPNSGQEVPPPDGLAQRGIYAALILAATQPSSEVSPEEWKKLFVRAGQRCGEGRLTWDDMLKEFGFGSDHNWKGKSGFGRAGNS